MPDLILHHYPMSPFSQKVRSMLGYAGLPWHSALHAESPPRPALQVLAGGYRKIPVAQAGADVFCDSRVIAEEIAARAGRPELILDELPAAVQDYVARVDLELFLACMVAAGNRTLRRKARATMGLGGMLRFAWDRLNIGRTARVPASVLRGARPAVLAHAADLEQRLVQDFLFGDRPNHADFSTFHGLWVIHVLAESRLLLDFPRLVAWLARMQAFGEGLHAPLTAEAALALARQATPRVISDTWRDDALIGRRVAVAPDDYARDASVGVLVGATRTRLILAREQAQVGTVHVHFPRRGYAVWEA